MKNLKVGDYVRIRKDLTSDECGINEDVLSDYRGKMAKITAMIDSTTFRVDIDNRHYVWDTDWFEDEDIEVKPKSHYEVGDYVRIRSDLEPYNCGIPNVRDYAGKLALVTKNTESIAKNTVRIDLDDGFNLWDKDWFEYRLGNYEDNDFSSGEVFYTVGFKNMGSVHTFVGKLQKWSTDKCEFINKRGIILMVDYNQLEYVIPKENA